MAWVDELLDEMGSVAGPTTGPAGAFCTLSVTDPRQLTEEAACAELRSFDGNGWVCFANSENGIGGFHVGASRDLPDGTPLWAELTRRDNESMHVRHVDGVWHVAKLTRRAPSGDGGEGPHRFFVHALPRIKGNYDQGEGGYLIYEVVWRREDDDGNENPTGVWRPWASRFVGMEGS